MKHDLAFRRPPYARDCVQLADAKARQEPQFPGVDQRYIAVLVDPFVLDLFFHDREVPGLRPDARVDQIPDKFFMPIPKQNAQFDLINADPVSAR